MTANRQPLRVGVVFDMAEENWPSMDLVGEMLIDQLAAHHTKRIDASRIQPAMRRRFSRTTSGSGARFTADRLISRFHDYPNFVRSQRSLHDVFHIVDHSYSQLVLALLPARTVVTCHDLDTFRSVIEPQRTPKSPLFRAMTRRILHGFTQAAHVACDTGAIRDELLSHGLLPPERVSVVPIGVHPACRPSDDPEADAAIDALLGPRIRGSRDILHVGSTITRKRIDVVLRVFAEVSSARPGLRLVRAGGMLTEDQRQLAHRLGITPSIVELPFLSRRNLAAVYRRAALVLLPSDAEGFGLPVVEAMASGSPVIASDLAVLREVGGTAAGYAPAGDVAEWATAVTALLDDLDSNPQARAAQRARGISQAALFTWAGYAARMTEIYEAVGVR